MDQDFARMMDAQVRQQNRAETAVTPDKCEHSEHLQFHISNEAPNSGEVIHISSLALLKVRTFSVHPLNICSCHLDVETRTRWCTYGSHGSHARRIHRRLHRSSHRRVCHATVRNHSDSRVCRSRLPAEDGGDVEANWTVSPQSIAFISSTHNSSKTGDGSRMVPLSSWFRLLAVQCRYQHPAGNHPITSFL